MVATGWVWSRAEERVSRWHSQESAFFRRERERDPREVKNSRAHIRGWGEVCPGYLTSAF